MYLTTGRNKYIDFTRQSFSQLRPAYEQAELERVKIENDDRVKAAFTSQAWLYLFAQMPFELYNAPSTFQRARDAALWAVRWQFALVFLDDVFMFSYFAAENIDCAKNHF